MIEFKDLGAEPVENPITIALKNLSSEIIPASESDTNI